MKKTQDKMALIFLIVDGFGSLNVQIDSDFSDESACVIVFLFGWTVKKLLVKKHCPIFVHINMCGYLLANCFLPITFKLYVRKKFWIYHLIQWNFLHLGDYFKCYICPIFKKRKFGKHNVGRVN